MWCCVRFLYKFIFITFATVLKNKLIAYLETIPVIILNWNGLDDTIACVDSVLKQSYSSIKIFVVDNGSSGPDFDALSQRYGYERNVELIKNSENFGFGIAHNRLFDRLIGAGYNVVALLNNDAVAHADWLNEAYSCLINNNADAIACNMLQYYNRQVIDSAGLKMLNTGEILPVGHGHLASKAYKRKQVMGFCAGACLMRLSLIEQIGDFDSFFDTGYEDAELSLRATVNNKIIFYEPAAIVFHRMGQSVNKIKSDKRTLKIIRDINYTALANLPAVHILLNFPFILLRNLFIILLFVITFRFRYPLLLFRATALTIFVDLKTIIKKRKLKTRNIGFFKLLKMQNFFLIHDFERFFRYIIKNEAHKFEN